MIGAMAGSGTALSTVLQLLLLLVIAYCVAAQRKKLPVCGPPRVPAYGGFYGNSRRYYVLGSVGNYYCNPGYQLYGSGWTVCIFDSKRGPHWLYPPPFCRPRKIVNCGSLQPPANGQVGLSGTTVGSRAQYSCKEGFVLVGNSRRQCQSNGQWSGQAPVCRPVDCGGLDNPMNGRVSLKSTIFGSQAVYSCNRGYFLVGQKVRTCQANGQWSGEEPICKPTQCDRLSDIRNGRVVLTGTSVGSTATYSCSQGFVLIGGETRTCQSNGEWSGEEPFCRRIECDQLSDIRNGDVRLTGTSVGSSATYSCDKGYVLVGGATRVCQSSGEWSGREPFCRLVDCGNLQNPRFGRVVLTGTTFGSTATYSCQKGYILVGGSARTCQANGQWSGQAPVCNIVDCGDLPNPRFGRVVLTGTILGSTATYSCQRGYFLVGGSARTCQANGQWSGNAPICKIVDCGNLANPRFGRVVLTGTTFGSTATYSCQKGYILAGGSTRTCQANGQWSGQAPVCNIVGCGDLPNPHFGKVILTGTILGSTATYSCQRGYFLVGGSTRTCQANGQWSGQAPICKIVDCGNLENPRFGRVVLTGTTFGSTATYSCQKGYILVGGSTRTCQANGQWSGQAPVCNIVGCGDLLNPRFGKVILTGTILGSTATYSCQRGYFLVGESTRTCQANGQWSGNAPICKIVDCGNLQNPRFGRVVLTGTTFGSTATYSCQQGYILVGGSTRTCQANGQWSGQAPVCSVASCGDLPDPRFGRVVLTGTTVGSTATYSCQKGYVLVGESTRHCQPDRRWSGTEPFCKIVDCGSLSNPRFGKVVLTGTTFRSTATHSCQRGYVLVGSSTRVCQANGQWSGTAPVCKIINCGNLQNPLFGRVVLTGTTFGSTATYSCQKGYILVGGSTRTCQANGQWSGVAPICRINMCERLPSIKNGRVDLSGTAVGSTATYSCDQGFVLVGEDTRRCQFTGEWTGNEPFCRLVECDQLTDTQNGRVVLTGTTVGSRASYTCKRGYLLVGDAVRKCQANGEWSGSEPVCEVVDCGNLQNPRFGKVVLTGTPFGSTATYSCQKGYILVGGSTRTCQANGQWSGVAPVCRVVDCGSLDRPRFGRVVLNGTTFGSTATYSCVTGYLLVGESTRTCQANGEWSGRAPICEIVDCGNLDNPGAGRVVLTGTTFGSTASYSCQRGFNLVGPTTRVCQANGQWSAYAPTCKAVDCGSLASPKNGRVDLTGTNSGSTATYSCQNGFILVGSSTRTCQINGLWSGQAPVCTAVDCGRLRSPRFGQVTVTGTVLGSTASYTCFKGYLLVGNDARTCQANGKWSGTAPFCKLVDCGLTLRAPTNGFAHVPCTSLGCTTTFWCRSGYGLVGPKTRTCLPNGYWSNETPTCQRKYY